MEQGGISIISTSGVADTSAGKSKSVGITFTQSAKEKIKTSWLGNFLKEDTTGWEALIIGLAEVLGTAILVFVGCTGCIGSMGVHPSEMQIALTFGLAVMIAVQMIGHISGAHINPSITVATLILGKRSFPMCTLYIGAQCVGAILGYGLIGTITPADLMYSATPNTTFVFCTTHVHPSLTTFQGVIAEFIGTAILIFFACGLWDCRNSRNTDSTPIRFGLCITVLCLILIPYTGCSLNPARSLGPAVWNSQWYQHWVYWIGPLGGSIVAATLYRCLFHCKRIQTRSGVAAPCE